MDIKYFKVATLFAFAIFVFNIFFGRYVDVILNITHTPVLVLLILSLVVIWGSYFILKKK